MTIKFDFSRETMPLEELRQSRPWLKLAKNKNRLAFVENLIASQGDLVFAVQSSYTMKTPEIARKGVYAILNHPQVREVLNLYFRRTEREIFLEELDRTIRTEKGMAKMRAMEMKKELLFGSTPTSETPATPAEKKSAGYSVGDIIPYGNQKIRITKIDERGQPLEGDPVEMASPEAW